MNRVKKSDISKRNLSDVSAGIASLFRTAASKSYTLGKLGKFITFLYIRVWSWHRALFKKRQHKFIQEQQSYQWELFDIEQDGVEKDRSIETFDFVQSLSFPSRVRVLIACMMLGSFIGVASTIFQYAEYFSHHYFEELGTYIAQDVGYDWIYLHWTLGAAISGLFCGYIAKVYLPECSGAGADATKICMAVKAPVPLFVGVGRIILSSIYLGMGNPLGTEAPTLHVTASVASTFLRVGSKLVPEDFRLEHLPTWVLVGMTAGLAAAFVAPLAGMLYAVEEFMNIRRIGLTVVLIGVASTFASLVSVEIRKYFDPIVGTHKFHPHVLRVNFKTDIHLSVIACFMGLLSAFVALAFTKLTLRLRWFNNKVVSKYIHPKYFGGLAGIIIGCLGGLTYVLTHSHGSWSVGVYHYAAILTEPSCEEEGAHFNRYESRAHHGEYHLIPTSLGDHNSYFKPAALHHCVPWYNHLFYFLIRGVMVIIAVSVGGPGGVFFPALLLGGSMGATLSGLCVQWDPENASSYRVLVVLGMVGLFSSLIRTPLTAILVTYEMSGYGALGLVHGLTYNMVLTSFLGFLVSECLDHLDFVATVMMQDGIDFHELFERGLKHVEAQQTGNVQAKSASYRILVEAANRADIEQTLADNMWMLRLAANYNVRGIHEHILRGARVDMNYVDPRNSTTCMQICIENELQTAVRLILFKKADPEKECGIPPITPLVRACRNGLASASVALMAYGASPGKQDRSTLDFPICAAAGSGNRELVLALIQGSASLNVTNKAGESPLVIAARNRHQHLVTILGAEAWKMKRAMSSKTKVTTEDKKTDHLQRTGKRYSNVTFAGANLEAIARFAKNADARSTTDSDDNSFVSRMSSMSSDEDEEDVQAEMVEKVVRIGWFTADVFVERTWTLFTSSLEAFISPKSLLGNEQTLKTIWEQMRVREAIFQLRKNVLIRHLSALEIQLFAFIGNTEFVLVELLPMGHIGCGFRYPLYVGEDLEVHDHWVVALEECLMSLFKFTPTWQEQNLINPSHVTTQSTEVEKTGSKLVSYTTVYHKHTVCLEIADPSGDAVIDMNIGLPVGEQFILQGVRYRWVESAEAEDCIREKTLSEKRNVEPRRASVGKLTSNPS